jgi:hypothetical protein
MANDRVVTLAELAAELGCSRAAAANWPAAGMPLIKRGGRGRGNASTVSVRAACEWLLRRPTFNENVFSMCAAIEISAAAERILRRLDRKASAA